MLYRISYILFVLAATMSVPLAVILLRPMDTSHSTTVGSLRCGSCHSSRVSEPYLETWKSSAHANAFAVLKSDTAQRYLVQAKDSLSRCVKCHSTLGRVAVTDEEQAINAEGVGCESCHGAGSQYAYYAVMRDTLSFQATGGIHGSLKDCAQCHSNKSDSLHCPFGRDSFDPVAAWKELGHPTRQSRGL